MPSHSPSDGQSASVAFVSGPPTVRKRLTLGRVTAISPSLLAPDTNTPAAWLRLRQTRSTDGASDSRSSHVRNIGRSDHTGSGTYFRASSSLLAAVRSGVI